jgi:hypothetical protein
MKPNLLFHDMMLEKFSSLVMEKNLYWVIIHATEVNE